MALTKVKLLGELGRRFGREHEFDIATPAEAIRALSVNFKGFADYLRQSDEHGVLYRVVTNDPWGLSEEQLSWYVQGEHLIIAPQIHLKGGLGRLLTGVALVAVALAVPASAFGLTSMTTVGLVGASLILGGLSQMLTPKPKSSKSERDDSFLVDRAAGTASQGTPIPLLVGECYFEPAVVLSSSLEVNEFNVIPPAPIAPTTPPPDVITDSPSDNISGDW